MSHSDSLPCAKQDLHHEGTHSGMLLGWVDAQLRSSWWLGLTPSPSLIPTDTCTLITPTLTPTTESLAPNLICLTRSPDEQHMLPYLSPARAPPCSGMYSGIRRTKPQGVKGHSRVQASASPSMPSPLPDTPSPLYLASSYQPLNSHQVQWCQPHPKVTDFPITYALA